MKTKQEIALFTLCLIAVLLSGWILQFDIPQKWKFAFLMALGIAVLMLIGRRPKRILLFLLAFTGSLYFAKPLIEHTRYFGLESAVSVSHTDVLALLLLLYFLAQLAVRQAKIYFFPIIIVPALAWLAFSSLSLFSAGDGEFVIIQLINMGKLLMLCWIIANSVENEVDLNWVLTGLMIGMVFQALVGIYQGTTGNPLGLDFLNETTAVHKQELNQGLVNRVQGTIGHPNSYAMYITTVIPFAWALLFSRISRLFKFLVSITFCLGCVALILSLSRAAWISFLAIISIGLVLAVRRKRIISGAALRIAGATSLLLLGLTFFGPKIILSRLTSSDQGSASSRIKLAQIALDIIKDHPLVGIGLNNYSLVSPEYGGIVIGREYIVHSAFLLIAAETGLIGLAAFIIFLAVLLIKSWRIIIRAPNDTVWVAGVGIFSAYVALVLHSLVDYALLGSLQLITQFWLLAGLTAALIQRVDHKEQEGLRVPNVSNAMARNFHLY